MSPIVVIWLTLREKQSADENLMVDARANVRRQATLARVAVRQQTLLLRMPMMATFRATVYPFL